jgi:hypothetical protein
MPRWVVDYTREVFMCGTSYRSDLLSIHRSTHLAVHDDAACERVRQIGPMAHSASPMKRDSYLCAHKFDMPKPSRLQRTRSSPQSIVFSGLVPSSEYDTQDSLQTGVTVVGGINLATNQR